jgi:hypothetical protein
VKSGGAFQMFENEAFRLKNGFVIGLDCRTRAIETPTHSFTAQV